MALHEGLLEIGSNRIAVRVGPMAVALPPLLALVVFCECGNNECRESTWQVVGEGRAFRRLSDDLVMEVDPVPETA